MPSADALRRRLRALLAIAALPLVAACGGGNTTTTTTTTICKDPKVCVVQSAEQATPVGSNTTEIVVDRGPPSSFALGVTNLPYVTVTVCSPGSASSCKTIDHVLLDSGSYGLRVFKSQLASLALPGVPIAADAASNTPAGNATECYPFVLGAVWGPLATADVRIGGELASSLNIQLIDDSSQPDPAVPANCRSAAQGPLLDSVAQLQANGILGIGLVGVDCGVSCLTNDYGGGYVVYYSCPGAGAACMPAGLPASAQVHNPVTRFAVNNNGTLIVMPALPELGAMVAKGRLVFGIGTQSNNQLPPSATIYQVNTNPASADYLYVGVSVGGQSYPQSYIDSGSNALFFNNASLSRSCNVSSGTQANWYCPLSTWRQMATLADAAGVQGSFDIAVTSADTLFNAGATAFADLGGSAGQATQTFALGMPFFYGRSVYMSIWGQALATNGPWYAF
jgi:hypothetical protein